MVLDGFSRSECNTLVFSRSECNTLVFPRSKCNTLVFPESSGNTRFLKVLAVLIAGKNMFPEISIARTFKKRVLPELSVKTRVSAQESLKSLLRVS